VGKDEEAQKAMVAFMDDFGSHELAIERYYDHMMARHAIKSIFNTRSDFAQ
jgi:outer membrane protein assembly factor BamD (BamD/ComL family)